MRTKLAKHETDYVILHKHWIVFAGPVACFVLATFLAVTFRDWLNESGLGQLLGILALAVLLLYATYRMIDRRFNIWVITNARIIAETGILSANFSESPVEKINNITVRQSLMGRILRYGDVSIQTAAELGETKFTKAEAPRRFVDMVFRLQKGGGHPKAVPKDRSGR